MLTRKEKEKIRKYFEDEGVESVRITSDGSVTGIKDPMPNTNDRGRVFLGWDTEILREIQ